MPSSSGAGCGAGPSSHGCRTLGRARRLRKGREFDTVFREGTAVGGPFVVVRYRPNGLEVTRWGFAVGKKLARQAARRNRLRRQLRECARSLAVRPGSDIVVTARARGVEASYAELCRALAAALGRAGLLVGEGEG